VQMDLTVLRARVDAVVQDTGPAQMLAWEELSPAGASAPRHVLVEDNPGQFINVTDRVVSYHSTAFDGATYVPRPPRRGGRLVSSTVLPGADITRVVWDLVGE
jgi:hypothetical protein